MVEHQSGGLRVGRSSRLILTKFGVVVIMLVRELVDALSAMNQDLQVMVEHDEVGLLLLERLEVKPAFCSGDPRVPEGTEVVVVGENVLGYRADRNVPSPGLYSK